MKLHLFLVPSSQNLCSKKITIRKVISSVLATLALCGATLFFSSQRHGSSVGPLATLGAGIEVNSAAPVSFGLSRKRGAFNKAVDILSDAADENPHLANYLVGVKKRLKGHGTAGEDSSGIQAVRNSRKISSPGVDKMTLDASIDPAPGALAVLAKGVASIARIVAKREPQIVISNSESKEVSRTTIGEGAQSEPRFTVGDMAFDTNPAIEQWMDYYGASPIGRRTMTIGINRSNSYLEMARAEFRNAGVPEDLVWLALVESVWNPRAVSPAAAGGIWQFIPSTATEYGLRVESGNDERADPSKQTRVAALYLHDLYTVFGDWALAMAAYNAGEPRVMGAIVKNGRADFWDLYEKQLLPKETCNYVPKILAAIKIAGSADRYGLAPNADAAGPAGS